MLRELLKKSMQESFSDTSKPVYVATSGGIDSASLVVALLDLDVQPIVTSFTLDTHKSSDFLAAKRLAKKFSLDFVPIYIPTDREFICQSVIRNMHTYSIKKKADIECMYPFIFMIEQLYDLGAKHLASGLWADGHFCLSKKGMIHSRHSVESFQAFRRDYFYGKEKRQKTILPRICEKHNMIFSSPFWSSDIFDLFSNSSWDELNKPRQKEAIRREFPELDSMSIKNHINLQLGDSGIADIVGETIRSRYTPQKKSAVSAYNYLAKRIEEARK